MCMWCTATRNLQRPELEWPHSYPLYAERDTQLFQSKRVPGVVDPPLSFVQSVTTRTKHGDERNILFSPENEVDLEALIESFKAGTSGFSHVVIHVHISFYPLPSSTPSSPCDRYNTHTPSTPSIKPLRFSTSAVNAQFIYPHTVSPSSYVSKLSLPSDVWKAFNPALCHLVEKPKLLILRDCVYDPPRDAHGRFYEEETLKGGPGGLAERERSIFTQGRYDIGAIDYRGHFDCSYSAWFLRQVGYVSSGSPLSPVSIKEEPF